MHSIYLWNFWMDFELTGCTDEYYAKKKQFILVRDKENVKKNKSVHMHVCQCVYVDVCETWGQTLWSLPDQKKAQLSFKRYMDQFLNPGIFKRISQQNGKTEWVATIKHRCALLPDYNHGADPVRVSQAQDWLLQEPFLGWLF